MTAPRLLSLLVLLGLCMSPPVGGARTVDERQLKAATIVSMLRLVTWQVPPAPSAPLGIVVIGDRTLAAAIRSATAGQRVDGRSLVVTQAATLGDLPAVPPPVVVLASAQRVHAPALARSVGQQSVLTIGEGDAMGEAGLVIGIYVDGDRIRFDANTRAASRAGLALSSHLLRLARIVG